VHVPGGGYLVLVLLIVLFGAIALKYARRLVTVARVLRRGVRAEGSCVRVETEPYNRSDATRHFFAFRTADGTQVEFEDLAGWSTEEGTRVTVTYDPHDPRGTATVAGRGSWSPVLQALALTAGCGMAALGFTVLLCYEAFGGG
jgi:YD repeat-containing protein